MRWKMQRETVMASMMTDSPGDVSTMSAAAHAASVEPCTAMPMSAFFSAGASFTPSPVMPTAKPCCRSDSTIRNLCSGNTCRVLCGAHAASSRHGCPYVARVLWPLPLQPAGVACPPIRVPRTHTTN